LTWEPPVDDGGSIITGFTVMRGTDVDHMTELDTVNGTILTYEDPNTTPGTLYHYSVAAINERGVGDACTPVSAEPYGPPGQPLDLAAVPGDGKVMITWSAPSSDGASAITGYIVLRGDTPEHLAQVALLGNVMVYQDRDVVNMQTYHYAVQAINKAGRGAMSATAEATPLEAETVPGKVRTLLAEADGTKVMVTWTVPGDDGGSPVTGYVVMRGVSQDGMVTVADLDIVTSWTDTGLERGETYYYSVYARNAVGDGDPITAIEVKIKSKEEDQPGFMATILLTAMIIAVPLALAAHRRGSQTS
jgi:hypothetical protein